MPKITLSPDQKAAISDIMVFLADDEPGEMVLGGKAGTGKSFLTRYILDEVQDSNEMKAHRMLARNYRGDLNIHLTSTTNKAVSVLDSATGHMACTIHRLLGLRVMKNFDTGKDQLQKTKRTKVIKRSLIIIDEASMISKGLLETIRELTYKCKVLFVGDPYQLAPVYEAIAPVFVSVKEQAYLTEMHRQAAGSSIIQFADQFRNALDTDVFPKIQSHGADVLHLDAQGFYDKIDTHFYHMPHKDYARIVAWSNNNIHDYNKKIRVLNNLPPRWSIGEFALSNSPLHYEGRIVVPTDGIIKITDIGPEDSYEGIKGHMIHFQGDRKVFQANNQIEVNRLLKKLERDKRWRDKYIVQEFFSDLRPMYANTVNKAQGSTYENVFIDLNDIARNTQNKHIARLMYTAITRASDKVYMFGDLPKRLY